MTLKLYRGQRIAVVVPCYNEEHAITQVVEDFRVALPEGEIHVFDNNSSDRTVEFARLAQADKIHHVPLQGKGNVVRRMFADVEADIYIMVDGDATYDAGSVRRLVDKLLDDKLDMVVGCRKEQEQDGAYRPGHRLGNRMLTGTVMRIFGGSFTDMLSGYRAFSRRYVRSFPALARGFETETELTVHALELRMPYGEVDTPYGARVEGATSKLSTYQDGWRILKTIVRLYMAERPLAFFTFAAVFLGLFSIGLSAPVVLEFLETGLVPRLPTAVLSAALMLFAGLSFACGLILDTVTTGRQEMKRLVYLAIPANRADETS